jgi:ubiquitin carboxyl-terminal hydrolase L3
MHRVGMPQGWSFTEVMGFDEDLLAFIPSPVIGIICNFDFLKKADDLLRGDPKTEAHFYMKQHGTLDNACGIIAALHAVLNNLDLILPIEHMPLSEFYNKTRGLSPEETATFLENYDDFKQAHQTFAGKG